MDNDNKTITDVLESMRHLVQILNNSYRMMQDFNALAETLKTPDILTGDIIQVRVPLSTKKIKKKISIVLTKNL